MMNGVNDEFNKNSVLGAKSSHSLSITRCCCFKKRNSCCKHWDKTLLEYGLSNTFRKKPDESTSFKNQHPKKMPGLRGCS